jgi:hypothetical protein
MTGHSYGQEGAQAYHDIKAQHLKALAGVLFFRQAGILLRQARPVLKHKSRVHGDQRQRCDLLHLRPESVALDALLMSSSTTHELPRQSVAKTERCASSL